MVHKRNKHMLSGFANPHPMKKIAFPRYFSRGGVNEARMHMDTYCRHVLRVPGAQDCIKDFLKELELNMSAAQCKSDEEEDGPEQYRSSAPVYSGFDTNTREKEFCWCCHKSPGKLVRCGHCKLAHYCDQECQMKHFSDHKSDCKSVSKSTEIVDDRREDLKHMCWSLGDQTSSVDEDAFDVMVDYFWEVDATQDYLRKRNTLAKHFRNLAYKIETKSLWNAVLKHQLDLLRLCEYDNFGVREGVPKVLLALNRDDDCYKFIRSWILYEENVEHKKVEPWENDTTTDRYGDPLEDREDLPDWQVCISLAHLVALLVVKMRIVAAYEAQVKTARGGLPYEGLIRENIVKMSVCDDI